jgi:hypothetical protein
MRTLRIISAGDWSKAAARAIALCVAERMHSEPRTVWVFGRRDVLRKPDWWCGKRVVAGAFTRQAQKINGVNAEEFLLLDASGKARAGLGLDKNGEVGLVLTSRDGNRKLALSPDDRFAVKLSDQSGRVLWSAP